MVYFVIGLAEFILILSVSNTFALSIVCLVSPFSLLESYVRYISTVNSNSLRSTIVLLCVLFTLLCTNSLHNDGIMISIFTSLINLWYALTSSLTILINASLGYLFTSIEYAISSSIM